MIGAHNNDRVLEGNAVSAERRHCDTWTKHGEQQANIAALCHAMNISRCRPKSTKTPSTMQTTEHND